MEIRIISVTNELEEYITLMEQGGDAKQLWEQTVLTPYWEKLCCYSPIDLSERKPMAIEDIQTLKQQVRLLRELDLNQLQKEFERIVQVLPNFDEDPITVGLFPLDDGISAVKERQNGVLGTALYGNLIIQINPLAKDYESWIPYVFAHEYHHTVWGNYWFMLHSGEIQNTLLDFLVIDGEADSFALSIYPDLRPSWLFDVSQEEITNVWNKEYKAFLDKKDIDYCKYMFGDKMAGIPWCCGYAIGYRLVQSYLKTKNISVLDILKLKPQELLKLIPEKL